MWKKNTLAKAGDRSQPDKSMSRPEMWLMAALYLLFSIVAGFTAGNRVLIYVLMEVQLILLVLLTLRFALRGYLLAVVLALISILQNSRSEAGHAVDPLIGLIYADVLLCLSAVIFCIRQSEVRRRQALKFKDKAAASWGTASVTKEILLKKNKQLEVSNRVIRRDRAEMYRLANTELLTGLPNRRRFQRRLVEIGDEALKNRRSFSLILVDLDNFKAVNDTLGHQRGDELIRWTAAGLKSVTADSDFLAHIGSDGFAIVNRRQLKKHELLHQLWQTAVRLRQPVTLGRKTIVVSASFGVASFPSDTADVFELMRFADAAMYAAKKEGKNRIRLFERSMAEAIEREARLNQALQKALERDEMHLVFQPQYFADSGKLRGFEALLRWRSPEFGSVPPSVFIPLAEKNGMIGRVGEWVLRSACTSFRILRDRFGFSGKLAVNVSIRQLMKPGFVPAVTAILRQTGFAPQQLEIEITETTFTDSFADVNRALIALKKSGIMVALDDFGTGYSSLNYLQQLPLDLVKIDKTFVDRIEGDVRGSRFIDAIITMVHELGIPVLAEGVETERQKAFLRLKHCDLIQGFLYGRPMERDTLPALLG